MLSIPGAAIFCELRIQRSSFRKGEKRGQKWARNSGPFLEPPEIHMEISNWKCLRSHFVDFCAVPTTVGTLCFVAGFKVYRV